MGTDGHILGKEISLGLDRGCQHEYVILRHCATSGPEAALPGSEPSSPSSLPQARLLAQGVIESQMPWGSGGVDEGEREASAQKVGRCCPGPRRAKIPVFLPTVPTTPAGEKAGPAQTKRDATCGHFSKAPRPMGQETQAFKNK